MAYVRDVVRECRRCWRKAIVEGVSQKNESHGFFCGKCAIQWLEEQNRLEWVQGGEGHAKGSREARRRGGRDTGAAAQEVMGFRGAL